MNDLCPKCSFYEFCYEICKDKEGLLFCKSFDGADDPEEKVRKIISDIIEPC
jgi:hypothetical protein